MNSKRLLSYEFNNVCCPYLSKTVEAVKEAKVVNF